MDKVSDIFRKLKHTIRSWGVFQWIACGVVTVCLVLIAVNVVQLFSGQNAYEAAYPENAAKIASLTSELQSYQEQQNSDAVELEKVAVSAYAQGSRVAALQNSFWDCYTNNKLGAQSISDALTENIKTLSQYFDENTGAGMDIWFLPDFQIVDVASRIRWSFVSDLRSTADAFEVLWLCRDTQGMLVAYATGVFDAETKLFSDIKYNTTSYGRSAFQNDTDTYTSNEDPEADDTYLPVDNVDIPAGYQAVIGADGTVSIVDGEGNPYNPDEGMDEYETWSGGFSNDFGDDFSEAVNSRVEAPTGTTGGTGETGE